MFTQIHMYKTEKKEKKEASKQQLEGELHNVKAKVREREKVQELELLYHVSHVLWFIALKRIKIINE